MFLFEMPAKNRSDIHEGMVGARGFVPSNALIVTWERMGFGGQPKFLKIQDYERTKRWVCA